MIVLFTKPRPKNVKFGTNVASSTRMTRTLRFLEKVFYCGKICQKLQNRQKKAKNELIIFHTLPQKQKIVEIRITEIGKT